jgi:hypothetical protein
LRAIVGAITLTARANVRWHTLGSGDGCADLSAETLSTVIQSRAPEAKDALMTLAEQWKAEGEAKGRAQGEAKGRAHSVLSILKMRQKVLTPEQQAIIEGCSDIALLDAWLLKAATLNDARELFEPHD